MQSCVSSHKCWGRGALRTLFAKAGFKGCLASSGPRGWSRGPRAACTEMAFTFEGPRFHMCIYQI